MKFNLVLNKEWFKIHSVKIPDLEIIEETEIIYKMSFPIALSDFKIDNIHKKYYVRYQTDYEFFIDVIYDYNLNLENLKFYSIFGINYTNSLYIGNNIRFETLKDLEDFKNLTI